MNSDLVLCRSPGGGKSIHPLWGILEISVLSIFFFSFLWLLGPRIETIPFMHLGYWMLVISGGIYLLWISPVLLHRDPPEWRGWGGRGPDGHCPGAFKHAWRDYLVFTVIGAAALLAYAWRAEPDKLIHVDWYGVKIKFIGYGGFGGAEDALFFGFVLLRFRTMIPLTAGSRSALQHRFLVAMATASLFAACHFPNKPLMAISLLGGFCGSWIFYLRPNILLIGLGHAVIGTLLHRVVQLYMRIGPFYAHPELHILRHVVPGLRGFAGDLF
jgi:hypothetical protein